MTLKTKKGIVTIDSKTFEALVRCKNELYDIYKQFGGISNIHLSKGLGFEGADWNAINTWEIDFLDENDPEPQRQDSRPEKIDLLKIAGEIYRRTKDISPLHFLNDIEIQTRIQSKFDVDFDDDTVLSNNHKFDNLYQLEIAISQTFGINLGQPKDYDYWLSDITAGQLLTLCREIKEIILEDED